MWWHGGDGDKYGDGDDDDDDDNDNDYAPSLIENIQVGAFLNQNASTVPFGLITVIIIMIITMMIMIMMIRGATPQKTGFFGNFSQRGEGCFQFPKPLFKRNGP